MMPERIKDFITKAFEKSGDTLEDIIKFSIKKNPEDMDESFCVWTEKFVYFPVCYDGDEWAGFVPRNPDMKFMTTWHGGG